MITAEDLHTLYEFCREAYNRGHDRPILDGLDITHESFMKTFGRLEAAAKAPTAPLPPALILAQAHIDHARQKEEDAVAKTVRIAKMTLDAAKKAGFPPSHAWDLAIEATRQECTEQ